MREATRARAGGFLRSLYRGGLADRLLAEPAVVAAAVRRSQPLAEVADRIEEYRDKFAHPYVAAGRGYLDDIIVVVLGDSKAGVWRDSSALLSWGLWM